MSFEVSFEDVRGETARCWVSTPAGLLRIYMSFWRPGKLPYERVINQDHDLILLYVITGTGRYEDDNGVECDLVPGVFLQRMPGIKHRIERYNDGPWLEFACRICRPLFERLFELGVIQDQVVMTPGMDAVMFSYLRDSIAKLRSIPKVDSGNAILEFQHFLQHIYRREQVGRRDVELLAIVHQACEILSENLADRVKMPEVAREIGLGYHHFRKVFAQNVGMSPKEYRVSRRIERSQELILEGMELAEISEQLGYTDQAAFAKQFKRVTGLTPGVYRTSW